MDNYNDNITYLEKLGFQVEDMPTPFTKYSTDKYDVIFSDLYGGTEMENTSTGVKVTLGNIFREDLKGKIAGVMALSLEKMTPEEIDKRRGKSYPYVRI